MPQETIYYALKDGGQLIFHDRAWPGYQPRDHFTNDHLDWLFHPARVYEPIFEHFLSMFEPTFCEKHTTSDPLSPTAYYVIARKLPRKKVWGEVYTTGTASLFPALKCASVTNADVHEGGRTFP